MRPAMVAAGYDHKTDIRYFSPRFTVVFSPERWAGPQRDRMFPNAPSLDAVTTCLPAGTSRIKSSRRYRFTADGVVALRSGRAPGATTSYQLRRSG
jgi:hypothetical protein